jgi:cytoskeletal protein CcmA (bactofilin family)
MGMFGKAIHLDSGSGSMTLVSEEAHFHGVLSAKGSLRVEGVIEGDVTDAARVEIGPKGRIKGNIAAESLLLAGIVEGDIVAAHSIELFAQARLIGNIRTPKLRIEEGAIFEGHASMGQESQRQKTHRISPPMPPIPVEKD